MNLLSNAVKFTMKGSIKVDVELYKSQNKFSKSYNKKVLHFCISDTGIGIPIDKQNVVFDSFTQVDNSLTKKYQGIGLGLSITKKLIELMQGKIWFESQPGIGTAFHFAIGLKYNEGKQKIMTINNNSYN